MLSYTLQFQSMADRICGAFGRMPYIRPVFGAYSTTTLPADRVKSVTIHMALHFLQLVRLLAQYQYIPSLLYHTHWHAMATNTYVIVFLSLFFFFLLLLGYYAHKKRKCQGNSHIEATTTTTEKKKNLYKKK